MRGDVKIGVVAGGDDVALHDYRLFVDNGMALGELAMSQFVIWHAYVFSGEDLKDGCEGAEIKVTTLANEMDVNDFSIEWHVCFFYFYFIFGAKIYIFICICKDLISFL